MTRPLTKEEIKEARPKFSDPVDQCLWDAADVIERRGWGQGRCDIDGTPCVHGAILRAGMRAKSGVAYEAGYRLAVFLGERTEGMDFFFCADWNDEPGRTATEVIAALRQCALQRSQRG